MPALPPLITDGTIVTKPYSWVPSTGIYYGYCTWDDVNNEFLDSGNMPVSANNPLFLVQVIIDTAIEMQNALEEVYVMPYTGTNLAIVATLNEINRKMAAAACYERVFGANEPDASVLGEALRAHAESRLLGIINGEEQWGAPFGDALPQGEKVIYPHSSIAQIYPNPNAADPYAQQPIFSMGRLGYRKPVF
jgi:hypothetical protein